MIKLIVSLFLIKYINYVNVKYVRGTNVWRPLEMQSFSEVV